MLLPPDSVLVGVHLGKRVLGFVKWAREKSQTKMLEVLSHTPHRCPILSMLRHYVLIFVWRVGLPIPNAQSHVNYEAAHT